eukprot:7217672-Prymnesium_polylepis.1
MVTREFPLTTGERNTGLTQFERVVTLTGGPSDKAPLPDGLEIFRVGGIGDARGQQRWRTHDGLDGAGAGRLEAHNVAARACGGTVEELNLTVYGCAALHSAPPCPGGVG